MAPLTPEQIVALLSALKDLYHSRLLSVCAITLAVYDSLLLLPAELETVYQTRWTVPKALYFYVRYVTPPGILLGTYQLSNLRGTLSGPLYRMGIDSNLCHAFLVGLCKCFRLVALYRRKRYMVWFIHFFFVASYAACLGLIIDAMVTYHDNIYYNTILNVCGAHEPSKSFSAVFYAPAAFEIFVFSLTAYRGWQDAKIITGTGSAPFLLVLYRDGFISFIVMTTIRVWNIWIYTTQPLSSYNMGTMMMWAISTVLTTRVYMNLVWLAKQPMIDATSQHARAPMGTGMATNNITTNIRMRVTTFTEAQAEDWNSKRPDTLSIDDREEQGRF